MSIEHIIIAILSILLLISLFYVIKFSLIIFKIEDAIEESLDIIDERYRSMSKILEIPLFFDSPQIRQVVNDIKVTRDTLLLVANKFASIDEKVVENESLTPDQEDVDAKKS